MGRDVTKLMRRVAWHMFFFHFVLQDGLIASKVILLPCTKLIVGVSYLCTIFLKNLRKWSEQIILQRDARYKMNKIKCLSPNSRYFNYIIFKITQYYNSPLKVLHLVPDMWGEL